MRVIPIIIYTHQNFPNIIMKYVYLGNLKYICYILYGYCANWTTGFKKIIELFSHIECSEILLGSYSSASQSCQSRKFIIIEKWESDAS